VNRTPLPLRTARPRGTRQRSRRARLALRARGAMAAFAAAAALLLGAGADGQLPPPKSPRQEPPEIAPALPRRSLLPDSIAAGEDVWHITGARLSGRRDGPVEIDSLSARHGELLIRALRGIWYPDARRVELDGQVHIEDGSRTLQSRHGVYYRDLALLDLDDDVQGRGPEGRFLADRLRYDRRSSRLRLGGRVRLFEEQRHLRADWLEYDLADSLATAGDRLLLRDEGDGVDVHGTRLVHDRRAGEMLVTGTESERPRLVRGAAGALPLTVTADTLQLRTRAREGEAIGWVSIDYGAALGGCDRARFLLREDRLLLTGLPLVEDREGRVSGDSMAVELREGEADRLLVWGRARSEYTPADHPGEAHFAVGDTLAADLTEGAITTAVLSGRAEALYLPGRRDRDAGIGLNWTRGQRIRLGFGDAGLSSVQFEGTVSGRYWLPVPGAPGGGPEAALDSLSAAGRETIPDSLAAAAEAMGDSLAAADQEAMLDSLAAAGHEASLDSLAAAAGDPPDELFAIRGEGYAPSVLAAIRESAAAGTLEPPDSLLARLPFDRAEEVAYSGRGIDFAVAASRIAIAGDARVGYRGMELKSEEIVFRTPDRVVVASGAPRLRDGQSEVEGVSMSYRIDSRMGLIYQGKSAFEPGFYRGERIKRVSTRTLYVEEGEFTSCDASEPHYHFRSRRMKIIPDEKVIARPVVLYIGRVPVLAIPYAVFPQRRGRQSGVLIPDVEFGFDTARGRFLRNIGYYWAASDYADGLAWMDYYERDPRLTWNARVRYRLRYLFSGQVEGSLTRQRLTAGRRDRWLLRVSHDQALRDRWQFKVSGHFQSDKDYADDRDFGAGVDERINRQLRSQLSLSRGWSGASLSMVADRTEYLDDCAGGRSRIAQTAPSMNFSLHSFPLGSKPDARGRGGRRPLLATMYLRGDMRFLSSYTRGCAQASETNQASSIGFSLSDKRRLLGAINLTPSASVDAAWAARGASARNPVGAAWRAGMSAGTTLYGTFFPRLGPLEGLRHVVEVSASYGYRPEIAYLKDFPSVGGIGLRSAKSSSVSLNATQRFHAKWRRGEKSVKQENLLTWSTSTAYDFLAAERARETGAVPRPWSDFAHNLRLQPGGFLESDLSVGHDPERWSRDYSLSLRTTLRMRGGGGGAGQGAGEAPEAGAAVEGGDFSGHGGFGDPGGGRVAGPSAYGSRAGLAGPWQMTVAHTYSRTRLDDQRSRRNAANLALGMGLTAAWRVQCAIYYDLEDRAVTSQGLSLVRDLHCWQATLERRDSGGRSSYYFRISVKELPDIKYERRGL